jgi:acetate kinase
MRALVFNPGSNSLKFELVALKQGQKIASEATLQAGGAIDDIGKRQPVLSVYHGREVVGTEPCAAPDMQAAVSAALAWLRRQAGLELDRLDFAAVRVVHGGGRYGQPVAVTEEVRRDIRDFEELSPLHNQSSLEVLQVLDRELQGTRQMAGFDTAFHSTLPEVAWRYPIERETADLHGVRKFGFHGFSHRYMLEQYAQAVGKEPREVTAVTLHLESGCSACAVAQGRSVDTTMGMTPLEGLMMGSRSGSIDPAIVPFLMKKTGQTADEILTLLNKRSGMLGIAGGSLDTRVLVKRGDPAARLALEMFSYRVRLAVGGYLAALGEAEAVLFGGGIGEDSPWLRAAVCAGLAGWGLELDQAVNERATAEQVRITRPGSRLSAWAMPVEEGLQIAHECALVLQALENG